MRGFDELASVLGEFEFGSEYGLGGGGSEEDEGFGLDEFQLCLQPWATRFDLAPVWLLVEAAGSLRDPLEVFDGVRYVDVFPLDSGGFKRLVEDASGWPDEGVAGEVFFVAGLFADEHDAGFLGTLSKDGLGAKAPEMTGTAV